MEDERNVTDDHDPVAENMIIEIEGRNINNNMNVDTNILVSDYNKIASHKVNIENENSATIHSDVNNTDPGIFRDASTAMSHSDVNSTDPDIFRYSRSERDRAGVVRQAEVEISKVDVELSKDTSFMRDKTGEVIDKDNKLGTGQEWLNFGWTSL